MLPGKPTGLLARTGARFLDFLLIAAVYNGFYFILYGQGPAERFTSFTFQIMEVVYFVFLPLLWSGYVAGKRIFKAKLITYKHEEKPAFLHTFLREVIGVYLLGIVTFGISFAVSAVMIAVRKDKRSLHDFIGGTQVVNNSPQGIFNNK